MTRTAVWMIIVVCAAVLSVGCGEECMLDQMKSMVPVFEGGTVLESYSPTEEMNVIKFEVDVSSSSQQDILDYYRETMTGKGWELVDTKDYGKNGSIMEFTNAEFGTLSVQTITKKTEKTGKIPVVLSLSKN